MGTWSNIVESFEWLFAERVHGKVHHFVDIAPIKVDFNIFLSCIIHEDLKVLFEGVNQEVGIVT